METFKNPVDASNNILNDEEQGWYNDFKKLGYDDDTIHNNLIPSARRSKKEREEFYNAQKQREAWKEANAKKPLSTTPEQMEKIRQHAIKNFGLANRFEDAFYMLPDGRMLSGTGGQRWGRVYDHRDIGSSYVDNDIDLQETEQGGNSTNMLDFMRGGNLRLIPESKAIDMMSNPTPQQMKAIVDLWKMGKINSLQASDPKDKYGQQLGYLEDIYRENQIYNFIKKYYGN